jgi:prepilin-type N-terminal cleavage/methylation domain-containing protein
VRSGFTLVELLVVLVVMGLMVGLVAPALIPRRAPGERDSLAAAVRFARDVALRRSEVVYLRVEPSGDWRVEGASSQQDGVLASGRVDGYQGGGATLVASPIGTCGFDGRSGRASEIALDPLTCELRPAPRVGATRP